MSHQSWNVLLFRALDLGLQAPGPGLTILDLDFGFKVQDLGLWV